MSEAPKLIGKTSDEILKDFEYQYGCGPDSIHYSYAKVVLFATLAKECNQEICKALTGKLTWIAIWITTFATVVYATVQWVSRCR